MKNLLLSMSNLKTTDIRKNHFKAIEFSGLSICHLNLFVRNGFTINEYTNVQQSNIISHKNTSNFKLIIIF